MSSQTTLFESFQREFCPPLDTSLLAAFLSEFDSPTPAQIHELRITLRELCKHAQAEQDQQDTALCEAVADMELSSPLSSQSLNADERHDFCSGDTHIGSSSCSSSISNCSGTSQHHAFSSPLGFLQAALPHIPTSKLVRVLHTYGVGGGEVDDGEEIDMEAIVETILTDEYVRELEERGVDGIDADEAFSPVNDDDDHPWTTVVSKKPPKPPPIDHNNKTVRTNRKRNKGKTITLVDIRQKQHLPPSSSNNSPDPWTTLSSLSTHLSSLLPPHPASFFQSYFHSPAYQTPYSALCAALGSISSQTPHEQTNEDDQLEALLDIIYSSPSCPTSPTHRTRIVSGARLALSACQGLGSETLDLVWLLHELDTDAEYALEMGVYHHHPPSASSLTPKRRAKSRSPPPPTRSFQPAPTPTSPKRPDPFAWQSIPIRKTSKRVHPLASHIPAYNTANQNQSGKGQRERYWSNSMKKRHELLREASRAWQGGNKKNRGGEVALYFAERAREEQEKARKEALDVAKSMVEAKRLASNDPLTVDLHGTTVSEAIFIVQDILCSAPSSSSPSPSHTKPLKIITGKGTHSTNKVGVLGPAVKSALASDGWDVGVWEGGLVVRGRL